MDSATTPTPGPSGEARTLSVAPSAQDLWKGIAGHFESFGQVLCEFIDNSISNFEANGIVNRSIIISLMEEDDSFVDVSIEDNGTGIADLVPVMRLGDTSKRESPLNEHGFGLKHALAHANPGNDSWRLVTRTEEDSKKGQYQQLEAPYSFSPSLRVWDCLKKPWPGKYSGTGTIVSFKCSRDLYYTLRKGMKGVAGFKKCFDYLQEDLGFVYSGLIKQGKVSISVVDPSSEHNEIVEAVEPIWQGYYCTVQTKFWGRAASISPVLC
jgi:hypothetical protein